MLFWLFVLDCLFVHLLSQTLGLMLALWQQHNLFISRQSVLQAIILRVYITKILFNSGTCNVFQTEVS